MFDTMIDQVKAVRGDTEVQIVKLGEVTALSGGKAKVKLYGDSDASNKLYNYIDGYLPEVGDKVALLPQARTYIILGKVTDVTPAQKWAAIDHNHDGVYLPVANKDKITDDTDTLTLGSHKLLPQADNTVALGSDSKQFAASYFKKIYIDGTELVVQGDRITLKSGNTTYSLVLTVSNSTAYLTPSANDKFCLGTNNYQLKEAWLGLFRGAWKSGNATEREIAWNSSNALVPDSNNAIDLGTASYTFKQLFLNTLVGAIYKYQSGSANNIAWNSASELAPNNTNAVSLGSSSKQFNGIYAKEFYINGTKLDIDGITLDKLTTKYGSTTYTLTLSVKNPGASTQYEELTPSVNNKFNLGNSSYKFQNIYSTTFTGDLDGGLKDGTYSMDFDSNHNLVPSTNNALSLGTSLKQYKNIYGQNIYVNGTAVSSDRNLKKDIVPLSERYEEFFKLLNPVGFKYKDGSSGRTHTGFIAQEVEEAAKEAGLDGKDIAVVVKDEDDSYFLRYTEIIAIQTQVIQKMQTKVDELEARIARLESLIERSIK